MRKIGERILLIESPILNIVIPSKWYDFQPSFIFMLLIIASIWIKSILIDLYHIEMYLTRRIFHTIIHLTAFTTLFCLVYITAVNPGYYILSKYAKKKQKEIQLEQVDDTQINFGGETRKDGNIDDGEEEKIWTRNGNIIVDEDDLNCRECQVENSLAYEHNIQHCRECKLCLIDYDHHCGVLGACIGKNNIICFWILLVALIFYFTFFMMCLMDIVSGGFGYDDELRRQRIKRGIIKPLFEKSG